MSEQNTTSLRQTFNRVSIIGYLKELKLEECTNKNGTAMRGSLTLHIPPNSDYVVEVYENQMTKSREEGQPDRVNNRYIALQTIRREYVSMATLMSPPNNRSLHEALNECSKVEATAQLSLSEFRGQDNNFASRMRLSGRSFSRVDTEFTPKATYIAECYISKISDEVKEGEDTGRKIVDVYTTDHNGAVLPHKMIVGADLADAFESIYETGQTAKFYGDLVNSLITIAAPQGGFGRQEARTTRVRELLITGGDPPYAEENRLSLNSDAVRAAVEVRMNETIPAIMAKERNAAPASPAPVTGFAVPATNRELAQAAADFHY